MASEKHALYAIESMAYKVYAFQLVYGIDQLKGTQF